MAKRKKPRRQLSPQQKAEILKQHIQNNVPISELAEKHGLQPSLIYGWQRQLFANMDKALENGTGAKKGNLREKTLEKKVERLQDRIQKKDSVIAEISEDFVKLKKELGEP